MSMLAIHIIKKALDNVFRLQRQMFIGTNNFKKLSTMLKDYIPRARAVVKFVRPHLTTNVV